MTVQNAERGRTSAVKVAVWFSNGAASAVALKLSVDLFGRENVRAINNPVAEEDSDNLRFQADVSAWVGIEIERALHPDFPDASAAEVWDRERAMVFPHGAPCTKFLKKRARQAWENMNAVDWHVFGFTAEERGRHDRFTLTERANVWPVLINANLTKDDCAAILTLAGVRLPRIYGLGFPNANCLGCVKATSPTYWNLVRRIFPEVFRSRADQSRRLGVRLVRYKGSRIFLDELPEDAVGRPMRQVKMPECGIHCEG
jgi:hypothetical protein